MKDIRVAHVFNMANDSASIIEGIRSLPEKELSRTGISGVDLIINKKDFAMAFPQWEFNDIQGVDPYHANWDEICRKYPPPAWVKTWNARSLMDPASIYNLYKLCEPYKIRVMHAPVPIYLQFQKPFSHHIDVIFEAGWGRFIMGSTPFHPGNGLSPQENLGRLAYKKAKCIIMTNPDMYSFMVPMLFDGHGNRKDVFIPFAINTERYRPIKKFTYSSGGRTICDKGSQGIDDGVLTIFHPSRMNFRVKGNDRFIKAFIKFHKEGYEAVLRIVSWGSSEDAAMAQAMLRKAGLMEHVQVVEPMSKPLLVLHYNWADVVVDQFNLGSFGTVGPEAMSCAKPVLGHLNDWNIGGAIFINNHLRLECRYSSQNHLMAIRHDWGNITQSEGERFDVETFGEMQPIANCSTVDEIYNRMVDLLDPNYRRYIGERARRYVERYHESKVVARQHLELYEKLLRKR